MTIPVTPQLLASIRALLQKRSFEQILKYDPNQPRNPSGSREGGRWSSESSADMAAGMAQAKAMEAALNSITGAGGVAKPPSSNAPTAPPPPSLANAAIEKALAEGVVQASKPHGNGGNTNATYKVTMADGTEAMYKPEKGEAWEVGFMNRDIDRYVTNREFSLGMREAFAYQVGDQLFGADNLVPVTVHRTELPNGTGMKAGLLAPEQEAQQRKQYEADRQQQIDRLYNETQGYHANRVIDRAKEMDQIWNEIAKEAPVNPYGAASQLKKHPVLPFGSLPPKKRQRRIANALGAKKVRLGGAERKEARPRQKKVTTLESQPKPFSRKLLGHVDPLEVLREAKIDVSGPMSADERARVTEILRKKFAEGYQRVGMVEEQAARAHFIGKDAWVAKNKRHIQSYDAWKRSKGISRSSVGGGGGGGFDNPDAPNPNGGSVQHWRTNISGQGTLSREDGVKMAVLDYLIGTMDRHPRNLGYEKNRPVAIDNGYSMPATGKSYPDGFIFRSAPVREWLNGDTKVTAPERKTILAALNREWKSLLDRHPGMNDDEREAFLGRLEKLKKAMKTESGLSRLWNSLDLMSH